MSLWFIFVLISVITISIAEISQKVSLTQKVNISSITNNFYIWTLMGLVGLILSAVTRNMGFLTRDLDILKLGVLGIVYFFGGTLYYSSYKGNSPSISQILANVSIIVTTTLGILWFKEGMSFYKFAGISLILLAIIILNVTKKERFDRFNLLALLGGLWECSFNVLIKTAFFSFLLVLSSCLIH